MYWRQTSFARMFQRCCLATQSYTLLVLQQPFPKRQYRLLHICSVFLCSALHLIHLHSTVPSFLEERHTESTSSLSPFDEGSEIFFIFFIKVILLSYHLPRIRQNSQRQLFFLLIFLHFISIWITYTEVQSYCVNRFDPLCPSVSVYFYPPSTYTHICVHICTCTSPHNILQYLQQHIIPSILA